MKNDFNKIKEEITLSQQEKRESFSVIESFMKENPLMSAPAKQIRSTPTPYSWFLFRHAGMAFAILIIVTGASTSLSAQSALPGDVLYPIKIGVNEKVVASFAITDEDKARTHIAFAQRRINEIEAAVSGQNIAPEDLQVAVDSLIENNELAISSIMETSEGGDEQASKDLSIEFETVLDSYSLASEEEAPTLAAVNDDATAKMSVMMMAAPVEETAPAPEPIPASPTEQILSQVEDILDVHKEIVEEHIDDINADMGIPEETPVATSTPFTEGAIDAEAQPAPEQKTI